MAEAGKNFALVVLPAPLQEPLIYSVPRGMQDGLAEGTRVLVPLGRRRLTGVVAGFSSKTTLPNVKEIIDCLDERPVLDAALLELCRWIAKYYLAPLGEVVDTSLPSGLRVESRKIAVARKPEAPPHGQLEKELYAEIQRKGRVPVRSLTRKFPGKGLNHALNRLVSTGAIEIREQLKGLKQRGVKDSTPRTQGPTLHHSPSRWILTGEQQAALQSIRKPLEHGEFETLLLFGITGSGKTEVYLRAMEAAWECRKRSLILVPEISLTPQLLNQLSERFPGRVGVLHSALTPSERWAEWWRILSGGVTVVVGARSAVFAPLPDVGLIVVDEEHDPSYKQEEGLRYHARDVAVVRGKLTGCPVVLGSATPSIESFENCRRGRYRLLELSQRVEKRPLPRVSLVDLKAVHTSDIPAADSRRQTQASKPVTIFSPVLEKAIRENRARGRQTLIFLNRRGFANFLQCRLCGFVLRCPHCSVSLTFHLRHKSVACHHCGFRSPAGDLCPGCGHPSLSLIGFGTEQVEQDLLRLVPQTRIARMDRDSTRQKGSQERLIREWEKGEIEILVGTQMVTKGHDVAGVTLVGVLLADLSLNFPDFRAAERTFQLLAQVAGRAGRGKDPGGVLIQTYNPDHNVFQYLSNHDYKGFFDSEIEFRRALSYPPFSRLVLLRLQGAKREEVEAKARMLGDALRERQSRDRGLREKVEILGPAPAPIEKLRAHYRWQILLKGKQSPGLLEFAGRAREILPRTQKVRLFIDVDPYNML